jgi:hypothetical protein
MEAIAPVSDAKEVQCSRWITNHWKIEQILCVNFLNLTTHIRISLRSYELLRRIAYPDRSI